MTSPRNLLKAWNLHPKKQLGQNFLAQPATAAMIVSRAALSPEDIVLEIGPGLGALTIPAAGAARFLYAVETDAAMLERLVPELAVHDIRNVRLIKEDILRFDIPELIRAEGISRRIVVMGNLPYHISSQIVVRLVEARGFISRAVLMFQREMAQRLMAGPGGKDYGRLSVMTGYCAETRSLAVIGAAQFFPRPKVDSEIVEIRFRDRPEIPAEDERFLFATVKAAFGQRRKTLRNSLSGGLGISAGAAEQALEEAGIDPIRRAETLSVGEFVALSHALKPRIPAIPPAVAEGD